MKIETYTISIPGEIEVTFLNLGGIIQKIKVPDKNHNMADVVLGFDRIEDYLGPHPYFGALIGRYANRIAEGKFQQEGKLHQLSTNEGAHTLHGGVRGFDKKIWKVNKNHDGLSFTLAYEAPDGEEGFPGKLNVEVTYTLSQGRELIIDYKATTDKATPINLTNHSYFNLSGGQENILNHELWINADHFTAVNDQLVPSGEIFSVKGSKDFRTHKKIGQQLAHLPHGFDHNYVLNQAPLRDPKARLFHPTSGRMLEIFTTEPGLQFYSGNFLDGRLIGKNNFPYHKHQGLCLETQHFPDSPNHAHFPDTILRPGTVFQSKTIYKFTSA